MQQHNGITHAYNAVSNPSEKSVTRIVLSYDTLHSRISALIYTGNAKN